MTAPITSRPLDLRIAPSRTTVRGPTSTLPPSSLKRAPALTRTSSPIARALSPPGST